MPKTDNPLTKSKTSPGVSFTIPAGKLVTVLESPDQEMFSYVIEIDAQEYEHLSDAARDVVAETFPGARIDSVSGPVSVKRGRITLLAHGRFPPSIRDAEGRPLKTVKVGSIVSMRVMLKAHRSAGGVQLAVFPSRLDVQAKAPSLARKKVWSETPELPLDPPDSNVPAPKPVKAKPTPKPKKPARSKVAKAPSDLPSNVIAFPFDRIRRP